VIVSHSPTVIIPIRDFNGMSRLSSSLSAHDRANLALELSTRAVSAAIGAALRVSVVSSSSEVMAWAATMAVECLPDPGEGLSVAADSAVAAMKGAPWMVVHADLPLVSPQGIQIVVDASVDRTVLVPSHDGGTNVVASRGLFPFAYGPESFHRHFASVPGAAVIPSAELSVDIDTPRQLSVFPEVLRASSSSAH
jgi:2-phospho-L-lactate guanylyltransferase